MKTAYIYGLICPIAGQVRYIGKSIRPKERLQNHMNEVSNCHRSHWLQSLKAMGLKPEIVILEKVLPSASWQEREIQWIADGKAKGLPLTNNTIGGDGVTGLNPDAVQRIRSAWIGRKHTQETKDKISKLSRLKRHTEEHKKMMSVKMKERNITWGHKIAQATRKLSDQDQHDIMDEIKGGAKVVELAKKYGVHRTTITKVKLGKYIVVKGDAA